MAYDDSRVSLDNDAWAEQYAALEKPLYNVVYRWLWNAEDSHDIVQEAFLRCWRRRSRVHAEGFRAFVYKTALNLAANLRRRRRLWQLVSLEALRDVAAPGDPASAALAAQAREAVDALPDEMKKVLVLSEIAGLSYREIADITGTKEGTVGSRRSRALAMLRDRLGGRECKHER